MATRDSTLIAGRCEATTAPAKVFLLIGQLGLGGAEKQLVLLASGLRERGVETTVLVMFEGGPREEALRAAGVPVVRLGFCRRVDGWRILSGNVVAFSRLVRFLRRERPDVLHAFLFHGYVAAAPAARLAGVPAIVAGRRNIGDFSRCRRVARALERVAFRASDLLIANADAVARVACDRDDVDPHKITVVRNGLPASAFVPAPPDETLVTALPLILCIANFHWYKGQRYLLQAVAALGARGLPCTLVLVGDGRERAELERLAARLGVDARFLGARTDVECLLARADVVVLPSLQEGLSNAIMEAMAAGRPVVATDVGGNAELLEGRGLLVPPADAAALARALAGVLTDAALARRLGERAREWCSANLRADVMVDRHIAIYRELVTRRLDGDAGVVPSRAKRRTSRR